MSKTNPLIGLIGQYGSDDDSEEEMSKSSKIRTDLHSSNSHTKSVQPEAIVQSVGSTPVPQCPWSACYDETSGYTYYWNHVTNAVTWEAPPEYLLVLKLAQQQQQVQGSTEVSAEEWHLYQQALAEKEVAQTKVTSVNPKVNKMPEAPSQKQKNGKFSKKRRNSESEEEKIELITSYHNSDSESNDEESPVKKAVAPKPAPQPQPSTTPKNPNKKQKIKPVEYGPSLPPNQNYTVPIGPELPETVNSNLGNDMSTQQSSPKESKTSPKTLDTEDEDALQLKLKDKIKLLEKLGGEIPSDVKNLINDTNSPKCDISSPSFNETNGNDVKKSSHLDIDDLLDEIEKKELPKKAAKVNIFSEDNKDTSSDSCEVKSLFPSSKHIVDTIPNTLFPSSVNIVDNDKETKLKDSEVAAKQGANIYLIHSEHVPSKKKLRISNSVLPEREKKVPEIPSYTTKYSQFVEGFSGERTGLGFSQSGEDDSTDTPKKAVSYGKGLMFTKGETLNEKDDLLEDSIDLLDAKLKFLNQQQPNQASPVQEIAIQLQCLVAAFRAAALGAAYLSAWLAAAAEALRRLERGAAPPGWAVRFDRYGPFCFCTKRDKNPQLLRLCARSMGS